MEENQMKIKFISKLIKIVCTIFVASLMFTSHQTKAQSVTQNIGLPDVEFSSLTKNVCHNCHGESLVNDHHATVKAKTGKCTECHTTSTEAGKMGVVLQRDCMKCHTKSPHHETESALGNKCTDCHDSPGLSSYSTAAVGYPVSSVTPTVANCRKCHGKGTSGTTAVADMRTTHHGSIKKCGTCHVESDKSKTDIRICERCHDKKAIHEVAPHIEPQNCVICHSVQQ